MRLQPVEVPTDGLLRVTVQVEAAPEPSEAGVQASVLRTVGTIQGRRTAARTKFFADNLLRLSKRFNGRVVHTESIQVAQPDGSTVEEPVIVIYEVHR